MLCAIWRQASKHAKKKPKDNIKRKLKKFKISLKLMYSPKKKRRQTTKLNIISEWMESQIEWKFSFFFTSSFFAFEMFISINRFSALINKMWQVHEFSLWWLMAGWFFSYILKVGIGFSRLPLQMTMQKKRKEMGEKIIMKSHSLLEELTAGYENRRLMPEHV